MTSSCEIVFEGLNVANCVNNLVSDGVPILNLSKNGKRCAITVPDTFATQVVAHLGKKCYNIVSTKYFGKASCKQFISKHWVLAVITVVVVVLMAVLSNFCQKVVISGDFDTQAVAQAMQQVGLTKWHNLADFDADIYENALCNKLNALYVQINRVGSVLYVKAVAGRNDNVPIDMTACHNVVCDVTGVVTSVLCQQGTCCVSVGDKVSKGSVLIAGKRTFSDGTTKDVHALGKVVVEVTTGASVIFSGSTTQLQPTGKTQKISQVVLFGKSYGKTTTFDNYTTKTNTVYLQPLNIAVNVITYYEMQTVLQQCSLDDCLQQLQQQAYDKAMEKCNFVPSNVSYTVSGNTVTCTLSGSCVYQ